MEGQSKLTIGQSKLTMGPQYGGPSIQEPHYGAAPAKRGQRRRMNFVGICLNVFLPWLLFTANLAVVSFSIHYEHPALVTFVELISAGIVLIAIGLAYRVWRRKKNGWSDGEPTWYMFAAAALSVSLIAAVIFGDMNFFYNMKPYYDVANLNTYPSVNPLQDRGAQLMDSGRVYFTDGSKLGLEKAMGFKNHDLYCVAPIVNGDTQLASYDFWAVGMNCCSGVSSDFRCGDFNNKHARAGLRLMRDDQRPFFRLAVQQAEAAYKIKAAHPIFFHWMQDPVAEVNSYRDDGIKYYFLGIFTHFAFNLFCVVCATIAFSKMGVH